MKIYGVILIKINLPYLSWVFAIFCVVLDPIYGHSMSFSGSGLLKLVE